MSKEPNKTPDLGSSSQPAKVVSITLSAQGQGPAPIVLTGAPQGLDPADTFYNANLFNPDNRPIPPSAYRNVMKFLDISTILLKKLKLLEPGRLRDDPKFEPSSAKLLDVLSFFLAIPFTKVYAALESRVTNAKTRVSRIEAEIIVIDKEYVPLSEEKLKTQKKNNRYKYLGQKRDNCLTQLSRAQADRDTWEPCRVALRDKLKVLRAELLAFAPRVNGILFTPDPWRGALPDRPVPAESPLELLLMTIVGKVFKRKKGGKNWTTMQTAIQNVFSGVKFNETAWDKSGMPKSIFVCGGHLDMPANQNPGWIITTSDCDWIGYPQLDAWAGYARRARMWNPNKDNIIKWYLEIERQRDIVGWPAEKTCPHLNEPGMSYYLPSVQPRRRCKRCINVFKYNIDQSVEGGLMDGKIYGDLNCAEVCAHFMCTARGLPPAKLAEGKGVKKQ